MTKVAVMTDGLRLVYVHWKYNSSAFSGMLKKSFYITKIYRCIWNEVVDCLLTLFCLLQVWCSYDRYICDMNMLQFVLRGSVTAWCDFCIRN